MRSLGTWFNEPIVTLSGDTKDKDIGIEVEVEGQNLPDSFQYWWAVHHDNSLKTKNPGDQAYEYVLKNPIKTTELVKALNHLGTKLANSTVFDSTRTSVHVHLNWQGKKWKDFYNFVTLWTALEPAMISWCRSDRHDNLFCLRGASAEGALDHLIMYLRKKPLLNGVYDLNEELHRYAALNLCCMIKFGSSEIRCLEGTTDMGRIYQWAMKLIELQIKAHKYENPTQIMQDLSTSGIMDWASRMAGPEMLRGTSASELWESARLAQELAYASDWLVDEEAIKRHNKKARSFLEDEEAADFGLDEEVPTQTATSTLGQSHLLEYEKKSWNSGSLAGASVSQLTDILKLIKKLGYGSVMSDRQAVIETAGEALGHHDRKVGDVVKYGIWRLIYRKDPSYYWWKISKAG